MSTGRALYAVALLLAYSVSGCAGRHQATTAPQPARSAAPTPPVAASPVTSLQQSIARILSAPELERGTWGVAVESLDRGDTLVALNPNRLLLPSSTMKVITLATAAARLGWDYTFETRLVAAGPRSGGELDGDLILIGSGDPSLDDWDGAATRLFNDWARQLKAAGITTVKGRLAGDATAFDRDTLGTGWAWDDLDRSFAAEVSGLQFNENSAQLTVTPGANAGAPPTYALTPGHTGLAVRNAILTAAPGTAPRISTRRLPGSATLELSGTVPAGGLPFTRNLSVPHPPQYVLAALRRSLTEGGIEIRGPTTEADAPVMVPDGAVVLSYRSPPLATLSQTMMKLSQNLYAETLLKTLGRARTGSGQLGSAGLPAGASTPSASSQAAPAREQGSWPAGLAEARSVLESWGVPAGGIVQADGSGLSRYNYATPAAMVAVLRHVDRDSVLRAPFRAALPVAGRDGTLEQRLRGTAAERTVIAKTGSMSNVRALAGYATAANGEALAFAVMVNNFDGSAEPVDRAIDAIVNEIASFSR